MKPVDSLKPEGSREGIRREGIEQMASTSRSLLDEGEELRTGQSYLPGLSAARSRFKLAGQVEVIGLGVVLPAKFSVLPMCEVLRLVAGIC